MSKGYTRAAFKAVLWKGVKILIGVAVILGALYSLVWVTGAFTDLKPGQAAILSPQQIRMTAITLCGIFSFFVIIGKV
ncbi:MAG: hypothetical protein KC917_08825 [Candidatus Omnitrophica bacterium]|nr:hypothetical protein [Candidatus Omnitrophota bacterium]MCA9416360.1 hypothetical protein [Candidatus Omnitrophota bacterium]MCA9424729.1 hypothetical protein [Candidatus Omnitrophota bacterium]MCA9433311.1 hypothetical protein [Candidatus Omnitrophota bacterium]MCA9434253.1 hypothetical protein [Candidatus Omnitrophota bacterium]